MSKTVKVFSISLTLVAFLLFSTIGTTVAYADDSTPPVPTETGTTPPVSDPNTGADPSVPVTTDPATPPTEAPAQPILEQLPENTTVTVVNADGEAQPLVSQQSADAIAAATDPIWCPATQTTPTPGANGCTPSFTSFDGLLSFLQANENDPAYQQAGTIYIEQGAYAGGEDTIDFNNYNFTQFNTQNLTLQGGWNPADNTTTSTSQFTAPIIIGSTLNPWLGSLTINSLVIDGVGDQAGLTLFTQGDATVNNVSVTNSQSGADINAAGNVTVQDSNFSDNETSGATINSGGNVSVTSSKFNNNTSGASDNPTGSGLGINSGGAVTLSSIEANQNQQFGANVQAVGNVAVTNGFFNGNQGAAYVFGTGWVYDGYGIQVTTNGNINLNGVSANDNHLFGAHLTGNAVDVKNSSFNANDSDWAEHSTGSGLEIDATGNVNLSDVTANDNQRFGADIATDGAVSITNGFFNGNQSYTYSEDGVKTYYGYGLQVVTSREVSLDNVTAEGNNLFGASINGKDVAIDTASFSNNGSGSGLDLTGYGLMVVSLNDVALFGVNANNNQLFGADITAGNLVAIAQSTFNGNITYVYDYFTNEITSRNGGYGLKVVTNGLISVENVNANNNYLYGAFLTGGDMVVSDSFFTGNGSGVITDPTGYGLKIVSTGRVNLTNINSADSVGNQLFGADITAAKNVNIINSFFSGQQTVTFTPCQGLTFYGYGLTVNTPGDITLDGVVANFNNLWGASLTGKIVTVYNSQFNNNVSDSNIFIDDTGLLINASDYVDIYNTEARENRLIGATIRAAGDVFITNSNFSDNRGFTCSLNWCPEGSITYHGYGFDVTTPGLIYVSNTTASNNNLFGALLNGSTIEVHDSTFDNNWLGDGVTANFTGSGLFQNVTATNNGGDGLNLNGACNQVIQVNGGTFSNNQLYGISALFATLNMDGTQTFVGNGQGNVFTDTSTCVVVTPIVLNSPTNNEPPAGQQQPTLPENTTGNTPGSFNIVLPPSNLDGSKLVTTGNTQSFGKKTVIVTTSSSDRKYERTPDRKVQVQVKSKDTVKKYTHKLTLGQAGRGKR